MISVYTDGGSRGNPGHAAYGVYICDENKNTIASFGKRIGIATNNVAEYQGMNAALAWLIAHKDTIKHEKKINVFADSLLLVSQINGVYKVKNNMLMMLLFGIREKEAELGMPMVYKHIPREENKKADAEVNKALDAKE